MPFEVRAVGVYNGDLLASSPIELAGGRPAWNLARWQRELTLTILQQVGQGQVEQGETVMLVAIVAGTVNRPDGDNRGRFEVDSGEFCEAVVTAHGATSSIFACSIRLVTPGTRSLQAHYTGSTRFQPSQSDSVTIEVIEGVFEDRFEIH